MSKKTDLNDACRALSAGLDGSDAGIGTMLEHIRDWIIGVNATLTDSATYDTLAKVDTAISSGGANDVSAAATALADSGDYDLDT